MSTTGTRSAEHKRAADQIVSESAIFAKFFVVINCDCLLARVVKTMIDVSSERMISLKAVPDNLPKRNGRKLNLSTVYRWVDSGVSGVYLETAYFGGLRCTSIEALARFDAELTRVKCQPKQPKPATDRQASRAHQRAMAKLQSS